MKTTITENLLGNKAIAAALQPPAKHTPGAWLIDETAADLQVYTAQYPNIIARIPKRRDGAGKANAALIAAAPDLLLAAEYIDRQIDSELTMDVWQTVALPPRVWKRLRATIARARE